MIDVSVCMFVIGIKDTLYLFFPLFTHSWVYPYIFFKSICICMAVSIDFMCLESSRFFESISIFANVDKFEGLFFEANIDHDHVLLVRLPLVTPQPALQTSSLLKIAKLGMLSRIFKLYQHALELLQTLHFVLPYLQLHAHWGHPILVTEPE